MVKQPGHGVSQTPQSRAQVNSNKLYPPPPLELHGIL